MKLVIDNAHERRHGGRGTDGGRPELRLVQGGRARRRHLIAPSETGGSHGAVQSPDSPSEAILPVGDLDDVPIYLRPIPAWVPRLW